MIGGMTTKHLTVDGTKAVCGAKGCWVSVTYIAYFVDCSRCERTKAFKAAKAAEAAKKETK